MSARVLIVDDILANVKLLEARLTAEYFEVLTANSGAEALEIAQRERADVVLLDVMMPVMDGFEVCRRLKANPKTQHVPVIMVTALDQTADKVQGLEAGADDFLTKPVDDIALITRVRNLARLKMLNDEMAMRAATGEQMGSSGEESEQAAMAGLDGAILIVDDHPRSAQRIADVLNGAHQSVIEGDGQTALLRLAERPFDLVLLSLGLQSTDPLRFCAQIRALERTRHLPIILVVEPGDDTRLLRGLDMGVNDYLTRPVDRNEMLARVTTQVKRKRYSDFLRNRLETSAELAFIDPLGGLYNRRYMESHLAQLVEQSSRTGRPLAVLAADIDGFRNVNDRFGHEAGDQVLREFAARLKKNTRGVDLPCRLRGAEFVVVMPDTDINRARQVAERIRQCVAAEAFEINRNGGEAELTASVGVAILETTLDSADSVLKRAEEAFKLAKRRDQTQNGRVAA